MRQISAAHLLAGSATPAKHVMSARFSITMKKSIACYCPFIKNGSSVETRRFMSLVQINTVTTLQRLAGIGIDSTAVQRSGQFELRSSTETYLQDGRFDQDRMLQSFEQMESGNAEGGFPLSRIVCRMDWVPDGQSHIDDLIEF